MKIIKATHNDLHELARFGRTTFAQAFSTDMGSDEIERHFKTKMTDRHFSQMLDVDKFYLARDENGLTGFVQVGSADLSYDQYVHEFDSTASELRRLYVLADVQSKGLGSALIEKTLQDPVVARSNNLYLTTWESNTRAQKLYEKHGFWKVGEIPEYQSDGELNGYEYVMVRPIRET